MFCGPTGDFVWGVLFSALAPLALRGDDADVVQLA